MPKAYIRNFSDVNSRAGRRTIASIRWTARGNHCLRAGSRVPLPNQKFGSRLAENKRRIAALRFAARLHLFPQILKNECVTIQRIIAHSRRRFRRARHHGLASVDCRCSPASSRSIPGHRRVSIRQWRASYAVGPGHDAHSRRLLQSFGRKANPQFAFHARPLLRTLAYFKLNGG